MIRSRRGLLATGTAVLLLGLVTLFPARVAVRWFAPPEIAISGIDGSVWHGSAAEASIGGNYFQNTSWRISPLRLLTGKLSYRIRTNPVSGFIESEVAVGLGDTLSLTNLSAAMPLALLEDVVIVAGLQGNASLTFERVEIVDGLPTVADGSVVIDNLVVPPFGRSSLGGYKMEFFTQSEGIAASIEETDGVVDLAGSLEVKNDRSYKFIAQVVETSDTPQSLRQILRHLPTNERGQRELRDEGIL